MNKDLKIEAEYIYANTKDIIAIIIPAEYKSNGLKFFTPDNFSQQLAYMNHPQGHKISAHIHNLYLREIHFTLECLFIRSGKIKIDFYNKDKTFITDRILKTGDVILLAAGGHGFTFLEESDIIEIKQGPHEPDKDKIKF
jgi:hypothetical protein